MALYWYNGQVLDDSQEGVRIREGAQALPTYHLPSNPAQVNAQGEITRGTETFTWDPARRVYVGEASGGVDFLPWLMGWMGRTPTNQLEADEQSRWRQSVEAARAIPTRDLAGLSASWAGQSPEDEDWWTSLNPTSPDAASIALSVRDKMDAGTATAQERQLYDSLMGMAGDWQTRASKPDPWSPLGDQFFGALGTLALGATGGLAAAPLAAGGASLATTLGSLGTLSGIAGTGAGVIGQATDQDWLSHLGLGLGIAGGLAGGLGGLSTLWSSGVNSLSDAAKLASSAGKITGSLGRIPGAEPLKDVSRYLGYAGQAGNLGASLGADDWLGWSGDTTPLAGTVAPGNVQNLLSAADVATQRGGGGGMEWDYSNDWGASAPYDDWSWDAGATQPSAWATFTGWGDPTGPGSSGDVDFSGEGSGGLGWLGGVGSVLGSIGGFLGKNAGLLGPAASALGSLGGGAIGSNAANEAARLQAAALNRGIDLSEAQWLQQLARTQPWVQAGQQALGTLQGLAGQQLPGLPGATPAVSGANYALPGTTPGWQPQLYQGPQGPNAGEYRWNPQAGPQAAQYRYTPGAVPTLSGQELLANDPGVAFRLAEGRKALEGSAAARGELLSGPTLAALQRQGQELSSQEYDKAWGRASQQAQLREQWNQIAQQMGWSQAESEARFREQMAQQSGVQNWTQALQGQQNQFNQGLTAQQWQQDQAQKYQQEMYSRMVEQSKLRYGMDVTENTTNYDRAQNLYKQQLSQSLLPWEQNSVLASLGGQMAGQLGSQGIASSSGIANLLGQLGSSQAMGTLGSSNAWGNALNSGVSSFQNILRGLNA